MALIDPLIFLYYLLSLIICCFFIPSESIGFTLPLMPANFSLKPPTYSNDLRFRSPVQQEYAQYYAVKILIGTPPVEQPLLLDTGSDLLWVQCQPCQECFNQGNVPFFHPASSGSSSRVPCGKDCEDASNIFKCLHSRTCGYEISYGNGHSSSKGLVLKESLTFDGPGPAPQPVTVPGIAFGCGMENKGSFSAMGYGISGIMGLNMERGSFISQLSDQIQGRFSYCLAYMEDHYNVPPTSMLKFGEDATLPSSRINDIKTIDIIPGPDNSFSQYYVDLNGISIGGTKVTDIPPTAFKFRFRGKGGCLFDTGANALTLEDHPYAAVMKQFDFQLRNLGLRRERSLIELLEYCYETDQYLELERYPAITLHFSTADYNVKHNYQYVHGHNKKQLCVAVVRAKSGFNIIGSLPQQDMRILFDTKYKKIQFMPDNCAA